MHDHSVHGRRRIDLDRDAARHSIVVQIDLRRWHDLLGSPLAVGVEGHVLDEPDVHAPLPADEFERKFMSNTAHGGWSDQLAGRLMEISRGLFSLPRLDGLVEFRR